MTPKQRSTDPQAFQDLPQVIGALSKSFPDGSVGLLHDHDRDQLLYASSGFPHVRTEREASQTVGLRPPGQAKPLK